MEVSYESFCSRQVKALCAMCVGLILVPCTVAFIFWTENDAVVSYATAKVVWQATQLETCTPEPQDAGKLVLSACNVYAPNLAPKLPATLSPFLTTFAGSQLQWSTEVYQYKETESKRCRKTNTGGEKCVTTYSCSLSWSSTMVDSSRFRCPEHPSNLNRGFPTSLSASGSIKAPEFSVVMSQNGGNKSGLALDQNLQDQLPQVDLASRLLHFSQGWTASYQRLGGTLSPQMLQVNGGYLTTFQSSPRIGDLRISLTGAYVSTATVAAKLGQANLTQYSNYRLGAWPPQRFGLFGKQTKPLEKLLPGRLSVQEFINAWDDEVTRALWLRRLVSLVVMILAFELILQPLSVAADLLRMLNFCTCGLGSFLDGAAQCVIHTIAAVTALCLFLLSVAIAWIAARPLVAIGLLTAAIAIGLATMRVQQKRRSARVALVGGGDGLVGGTPLVAPSAVAMPVAAAAPPPMAMAAPTMPVATAVPVADAQPVRPSIQVVCPVGTQPGQMLSVQTPHGQVMAEVPAGVQPGQVFNVQLPP